MSTSPFAFKSRTALVLLGAACLSQAAQPAALPLDAGSYVVSSVAPCKEAPLAAVVQFDGRALFGPHESDCTSLVLSQRGRTYQVATECRALGDGTRAAPYRQVQRIRVESRTRLSIGDAGAEIHYALCPAFH